MTRTKLDQDSDAARLLGFKQTSALSPLLRRRLTWLVLAMTIAIVGLLWMRGNNTEEVQYKTDVAQRGNLVVTVTTTGTLEPTNQVDVGIEVSGTVETVEADYNDEVKFGQVLARLDTSKFQAQVLKSKAALESARAKLLQTQATVKEAHNQLARLEQVRQLSGGKVPSQHDLDAAQAALQRAQADEASARAAIAEAQATLDLNETDLIKAVIHSPINGIVLSRTVEPGQTVAASFQAPVLFTLAEDLTKMELHVDVDEADVGQVQEKQQATFTVDAYPDRTFTAQITQVRYGAQTVDGVVTYETVLQVDNSDMSLRPGMTATADITVKTISNAIVVPNAALRFRPPVQEQAEPSRGGGVLSMLFPRPPRSNLNRRDSTSADQKLQRVWTLRNGRPVAIAVTTGATDGKLTEIMGSDIEPGMELVVDATSPSR